MTRNELDNYQQDPLGVQQGQPDMLNAQALNQMGDYGNNFKPKKKHTALKVVIISALAVLIVAAGVYTFVQQFKKTASSGASTDTAVVMRGDFEDVISTSGNLQPISATSVVPGIDGTIASVDVAEGQDVKKGDLLFTLTNDDLDSAVKEAEFGVKMAEAGLTSAQSSYDSAKKGTSAASQDVTEANSAIDLALSRAKDILEVAKANSAQAAQEMDDAQKAVDALDSAGALESDPEMVSAQDTLQSASSAAQEAADMQAQAQAIYDEAVAVPKMEFNSDDYDSAVTAASQGIESAQMSLEQAQNQLKRAQEASEERNVTAPSDGSVISVNAEVGQQLSSIVSTGAPVRIADLSKLTMSVQINEVDILKLEKGMPASITVDAIPGLTMDAEVGSIAKTSGTEVAGADYGMGGVVTYAVQLIVEDPDPRVLSGMSARANISVTSLDNVLTVSKMAIQTDENGDTYLNLIQGDSENAVYEKVLVKVIASDGVNSVIEADGVEENDVVEVVYSTQDDQFAMLGGGF